MNLRDYIKRNSITQRQLSEWIGVSENTIVNKLRDLWFTQAEMITMSEKMKCAFIIDKDGYKVIEKSESFYDELIEFTAKAGYEPEKEIIFNKKKIKIVVL